MGLVHGTSLDLNIQTTVCNLGLHLLDQQARGHAGIAAEHDLLHGFLLITARRADDNWLYSLRLLCPLPCIFTQGREPRAPAPRTGARKGERDER